MDYQSRKYLMRKNNNINNSRIEKSSTPVGFGPLINTSKKSRVCSRIVYCRDFFSQGIGLTFHPKSSVNDCAYIFVFGKPRIVSLTMAFVFFPIDVLFLDDKKMIIEIKKDFMPWSFYTPKKESSYIIELEKGLVSSTKSSIGDCLEF